MRINQDVGLDESIDKPVYQTVMGLSTTEADYAASFFSAADSRQEAVRYLRVAGVLREMLRLFLVITAGSSWYTRGGLLFMGTPKVARNWQIASCTGQLL